MWKICYVKKRLACYAKYVKPESLEIQGDIFM